MSTSKALSLSTPVSGDPASSTHTVFQDTKTAIDERFQLEHVTLVSAAGENQALAGAAGRHKPGYTRAVLIDDNATIVAITGAASESCLAIDTDNKVLRIGNGSNWTTYVIGLDDAASKFGFRATLSAAQTITTGTWTKVELDTEAFDSGSIFASNKLTITIPGLYGFSGLVCTSNLTAGRGISSAIYKNGALLTLGPFAIAPGLYNYSPCSVYDRAIATDYYELYVYHNKGSDMTVLHGTDQTMFSGALISR